MTHPSIHSFHRRWGISRRRSAVDLLCSLIFKSPKSGFPRPSKSPKWAPIPQKRQNCDDSLTFLGITAEIGPNLDKFYAVMQHFGWSSWKSNSGLFGGVIFNISIIFENFCGIFNCNLCWWVVAYKSLDFQLAYMVRIPDTILYRTPCSIEKNKILSWIFIFQLLWVPYVGFPGKNLIFWLFKITYGQKLATHWDWIPYKLAHFILQGSFYSQFFADSQFFKNMAWSDSC